MSSVDTVLQSFNELEIELSSRELKAITQFVNDNENTNSFEEVSYTFNTTPKPAKRPRVGVRGFYDPDQAAKKDFTKFILSAIGHDDSFIKEWLMNRTKSTKKRNIDPEDRDLAKKFIIDNCLFLGQCKVSLDIYLPVPKTMAKFKKKLAYIGYIRPENKPDIDNYEKFIYDSINSIFFLDDGQIVSNENNLFYCEEDNARIDIHIQYRPRSLL